MRRSRRGIVACHWIGIGPHRYPWEHARRIHLQHVQARPALPARPDGARGHLDLVLPGRQDRRHRAERSGQVEPAADHGRPRRRLHRRSATHARLHRRLPEPGAAARPGQGRQGQRHGRGRTRSRRCSTQYNAVMAKWSDPDADYEAVGAEQSALEDRINAADAWNVERNVEIAMEALRCPPDDADVSTLSGGEKRRVALARLLLRIRTCCSSTSRRTTSTPSRSSGWSASSTSTRARSSPSPTTATSSTTSRSGSWSSTGAGESRSPATTRAGSSRSWSGCRASRSRPTPASGRSPASSSGSAWARRRARPRARRGCRPTSSCSPRRTTPRRPTRELEIAIPPGPRLGDTVIEVKDLRKGYGDRLLIEDLTFSLPRAGIVGIIGPNGAGKTTLFRMLVGQEAPDAGTDRDRRHRPAELRRPEPGRRSTRDKTVFQEITQGVEVIKVGNARAAGARLRVVSFNFRGHRPAEARRDAVGRRAEPRPPREAAPVGRQRPAPRRADERPRRRHPPGARGGPRDRSRAASS